MVSRVDEAGGFLFCAFLPPGVMQLLAGGPLTAIDLLSSVNNPLLFFLHTDGQKYQTGGC